MECLVKSDGTGVNVQPVTPVPSASPSPYCHHNPLRVPLYVCDPATPTPTPTPTTTPAPAVIKKIPVPIVTPQNCPKFQYQKPAIVIKSFSSDIEFTKPVNIPACRIQVFSISTSKNLTLSVDGGGTGIAIVKDEKVLAKSTKKTKGKITLPLAKNQSFQIEAVSRNAETYQIRFKSEIRK
ncbi:MAG: hypothetical protein WBB28_20900 [Crinalium sp.]